MLIDKSSVSNPCRKNWREAFNAKLLAAKRSTITQKEMASVSSYSSSDEESFDQSGVRKRRRLSPVEKPAAAPLATASRIKAKQTGPPSRIANGSNVPANPVVTTSDKLSFASLNVSPWLIASLAAMEIKKPTGIQKECIPEILKGRDCIGGSRTGTGKTVAFSVPILQKWSEDPCGIFAVMITYVTCQHSIEGLLMPLQSHQRACYSNLRTSQGYWRPPIRQGCFNHRWC